MRRILVPLDGSAFAESALDTALGVARAAHAELHLVQVHESRRTAVDAQAWIDADPDAELQARAEEEAYLSSLVDRCATRGGVRACAELIDGEVVATLARYARDAAIDLVIMTTHGRGGISRVWLGSVADALVRACEPPILLLRPPEAGQPPRALRGRARVVVPLDGSDHSEAVLDHAIALGRLFDASFVLLHALPVMPAAQRGGMRRPAVEATREQRSVARGYLDEVAARLRRQRLNVTAVVRENAVAALAILDEAGAAPNTLVAMATHGRGGWSRVALGSVADKVLRGADAPVLLYRPTPAALRDATHGAATQEGRTA